MLATAPNKQYQIRGKNCIQGVPKTDTQVRLGKDSIDQLRSDKDSKEIDKMIGASDGDLTLLISKGFIVTLENGIEVTKKYNSRKAKK